MSHKTLSNNDEKKYSIFVSDYLKQQYFSNEIKRVEGDIKGTWKTVNKLLNKSSKTTEIPYLEEDDGEIITDPQDTADKLNTYFSTIGENIALLLMMILLCRLRLAPDSGLRS